MFHRICPIIPFYNSCLKGKKKLKMSTDSKDAQFYCGVVEGMFLNIYFSIDLFFTTLYSLVLNLFIFTLVTNCHPLFDLKIIYSYVIEVADFETILVCTTKL